MSQFICPLCEGEFHDAEDHRCAGTTAWVSVNSDQRTVTVQTPQYGHDPDKPKEICNCVFCERDMLKAELMRIRDE